jgi:hypothetical protein
MHIFHAFGTSMETTFFQCISAVFVHYTALKDECYYLKVHTHDKFYLWIFLFHQKNPTGPTIYALKHYLTKNKICRDVQKIGHSVLTQSALSTFFAERWGEKD